MADPITYVGLDVHKDEDRRRGGRGGCAARPGIWPDPEHAGGSGGLVASSAGGGELGSATRRVRAAMASSASCRRSGEDCIVVAPSLIPKRAGDRVKTDRRDAAAWPAASGGRVDGGLGSRSRARGDARSGARPARCGHAVRRARQQLSGFLLRQGFITGDRPGPSCIGAGWPGSNSSSRSIISCWKTTLRRSKPPRRGVTG